ncbi:insulinase family protein [Flavobacterium luteum]|uniref:Insulinase family protein n=2 Tax=Flavobacterium luteum TaxID=2026654 RepID=A0A7J5AFH8_9FLAO|nr:insulinase family protein [Flavobacterium luteum]
MQTQIIPQPKPGPLPSIKIGKPQTFELKNGLKVLVVENHKLPRVSFSLSIDNTPYTEGSKKGVSELTSALIGSGTTKISKDAFNEEVDFLGANINFENSGAYASGLSKYANRILELMADGALNPVFTQEEFDKNKSKLIEGLKADEKNVQSVARRVQNVLTFGGNHHLGEYLSEATINNVTLEDVISNYNTFFVPENAYLVIIGDVKFDIVKKQVEILFDPWLKATAPNLTIFDPKNVQYSQINFIDMPNAVQSEIAVMNVSNLKMTDKDYFATILANEVLGGSFNSYLNMNLREKHAWAYGAWSGIGGSKYVSSFGAYSQVRNAVTDSAVVEFLKEIKRIRTEKVSDEDLRNVKASYIGNFVMQIEKPQTIAGYALRTKTQGLPEDFYENYIKNINAVTPEDVLRAANKYFLADNARIVIVGKGSEVLPGLEKLKIPIFYFDKYGAPVEKKVLNKTIPAGVTAKSVIDNYIKTIGGLKALSDVKSILTISYGTIQGAQLELTSKTTSSNKMLREIKAMGMSMMKQVVNEKGAYLVQQGERKDLTGNELTEMKASANTFDELLLSKKEGVILSGIEEINGAEAYVIKDKESIYYYDVTSGLKVAESKILEQEGQKITQTTNYSDYKEVKGIKFPFKTILNIGMEIELTTTTIKINEGVSDADFK